MGKKKSCTETVRTKTVVIRWQEVEDYECTLRVVIDFDPDNRDLANGLAEIEGDYIGVTRQQIEVEDAASPDPDAEFFDPPTWDD